jgi:hypothetical protein
MAVTTTPTSPPSSLGGPVSAALEAEVRAKVQRHGIVVWLDQAGLYKGFVDRLQQARARGEVPYAVHAFRGSHLALMLALDGVAAGTVPGPLLLHLPGFTEESVRRTPWLELYEVGCCFRRALDTLVTEAAARRVPPERIDEFKAQPGMTLASADAWLAGLLDASAREGDGTRLAQLRAMRPEAVLDDLLDLQRAAAEGWDEGARVADLEALGACFAAWFGMPGSWRDAALPPHEPRAGDLAFAAAGWTLCVEYVEDLRRPPVSGHLQAVRALPRGVVDVCRRVAVHLRERHPGFYRRTADETEALLADEVDVARAEDLGQVDTFRFEEDRLLKAALTALQQEAWDRAASWAGPRAGSGAGGGSFWLREQPERRSAWQLVAAAARLGQAMVQAGASLVPRGGTAGGIEEALEAYVSRGAAVDQAHRQLEQRRMALLYLQVPEFERLRTCLDGMREAWRAWADGWAESFNALCMARGFLPPASQQQRTLFDEVVLPMTREPGITALFLVDALRYELGEEFFRQLEGTAATNLRLRARLAELPTVTEVGMNVLAPVARGGRLLPAMTDERGSVLGFQAGEFRVHDPETRRRAMHDRVGGTTCPCLTLEEVVSREPASLRRAVAQAKLVMVHSQEIDQAGEKGFGPAVFDLVLQKLRAAWRHLREAGVRRFVFTADHGFLLLDEGGRRAQAHGRRIDPSRRHVFSPVAADHRDEARVPLAALGWEGVNGHVMFPMSTAVFDTGRRGMSFVHGGNSLQERVIPVLTVVHRSAAGGSTLHYRIVSEERDGVGGMHCLGVQVEVMAQGALDFGSALELELALRVAGSGGMEDVQVELCQTRGQARIEGGVVVASVGERFELFFRLSGSTDARVRVEVYHPGGTAAVQPETVDARFAVTAHRGPTMPPPAPQERPAGSPGWLDALPDEPTRKVFDHLTRHGVVTEPEAAAMLGGPRAARRFAVAFESLAAKAPFAVRIEVVAGVKRYVREGSE